MHHSLGWGGPAGKAPGAGGPTVRKCPRVGLVHERRDDQTTIGLLALAVRLDVVAALQMLVDDLALERRHRLQRDRTAVVDGGLGSLVGSGPERDRAAFAVAGRVDHDALTDRRAAPRDALGDSRARL